MIGLGYEGKIAVVTGAASGIGKAVAEMLVEQKAKVYALDISAVKLEGIERAIAVDLGDKDSIDRAFRELPEHIDSFFGVAGVQGNSFPFIKTMKIDFVSNKYMAETYLRERMGEGGSLCYVSSATAAGWQQKENLDCFGFVDAATWEETVAAIEDSGLTRLPMSMAYICAKMALNYYAAKLQSVFGAKGARVNVVFPGATMTAFGSESTGKNEATEEEIMAYIPYSRRLARAEEAAYPLLFLNSQWASYVSGTMLYCDYGVSIEKDAGLREGTYPTFTELLRQTK